MYAYVTNASQPLSASDYSNPQLISLIYNHLQVRISNENCLLFQVETIGDGYMVVSGLPEPNADKHISQICDMALCLLDEANRFKIQHRPEHKLQLRIGVNTGPCAAGISINMLCSIFIILL